jgi:hypothetical protein
VARRAVDGRRRFGLDRSTMSSGDASSGGRRRTNAAKTASSCRDLNRRAAFAASAGGRADSQGGERGGASYRITGEAGDAEFLDRDGGRAVALSQTFSLDRCRRVLAATGARSLAAACAAGARADARPGRRRGGRAGSRRRQIRRRSGAPPDLTSAARRVALDLHGRNCGDGRPRRFCQRHGITRNTSGPPGLQGRWQAASDRSAQTWPVVRDLPVAKRERRTVRSS